MYTATSYPNRMQVGRGSDEIGQPSIWAAAAMQELHNNAEKKQSLIDRRSNRQTDWHSGLLSQVQATKNDRRNKDTERILRG